jgi:hypothetical protein
MKSVLAFVVSLGLLGVAFGGGRAALMFHTSGNVVSLP